MPAVLSENQDPGVQWIIGREEGQMPIPHFGTAAIVASQTT